MNHTISVYNYLDPIQFLNDKFKERQLRNHRYSLRAWSRSLGLKEPTPLSQILLKKRPIPHHYIAKFGKSLNLNSNELGYLEAIVGIDTAKDAGAKELWTKQAQKIFRSVVFELDWIEDFEMFQSTVPMILLELVELKEFILDVDWIHSVLKINIDKEVIKKTYENLIDYGYLEMEKDGRLRKLKKHVTARHDVASLWVKMFHEEALKQATQAIYRQGIDEREFGSYIIPMEKAHLPAIKQKIREFTNEILSQYTSLDNRSDSIYHLNINLFLQASLEDAK
ncbi:MAG: TIGR02147 family protein [Bacteriovoracaceae bacterium]